MFKALFVFAALGSLPIPEAEIRTGSTSAASTPRLIPGYPPRQLFTREHQGQTVRIWGWQDTEGIVHWFASENPHVATVSVEARPRVPNYGVQLNLSPSAVHRAATGATYQVGAVTTNDPAFGPAFYQTGPLATAPTPPTAHAPHPGKPCPGPGPCPNPSPRPNPLDPRAPINYRDYLFLGVAVAACFGVVIYRRRKGL